MKFREEKPHPHSGLTLSKMPQIIWDCVRHQASMMIQRVNHNRFMLKKKWEGMIPALAEVERNSKIAMVKPADLRI
jgi:hypothetical protein